MADLKKAVAVTELLALYQLLVESAAQLAAAEAELRRLAEEEFVSVRYRVSPNQPGALRAGSLEVAKWARGDEAETTGVSRP